jgi:DNA-directed RNA polymerase specialized sigma24 family protein
MVYSSGRNVLQATVASRLSKTKTQNGGCVTAKTTPQTQRPLVNSVDRLGRCIEPCVLSVASEIAQKALSYAEKFVGDPCVALNLLEEAAASVSETVRAKAAAQVPPIRDLGAYLYRAFLRRITEEQRNEDRQQQAFEDRLGVEETASFEAKEECKLLLKQILGMCDRKTRHIIWNRIEGRSWDDIAYGAVMSNHAARLHYSKALREIRKALKTDTRRYTEKVKAGERREQKKARLMSMFERLYAVLLFRVLRVKQVSGEVIHITHHEKEEILAEVDRMFS